MFKVATNSSQDIDVEDVRWVQCYLKVASRQRQKAQRTTLPKIREQLLRSAEKWEFLASSPDAHIAGYLTETA